MNQFAMKQQQTKLDPICGDLMAMAERELASFVKAVTKMFGSEQAKLSADDWLHELMNASVLPASTRQWRQLTAKVTQRLASRMFPHGHGAHAA